MSFLFFHIFISQNIDMKYKLFTLFFALFLSQLAKSQNEFITIWKPSGINPGILTNVTAPSPSTANQIWFPEREQTTPFNGKK